MTDQLLNNDSLPAHSEPEKPSTDPPRKCDTRCACDIEIPGKPNPAPAND
jgi:hypothetical protein